MAVTTTERIILLANDLLARARSLPHLSRLTIQKGETFRWDHTACAIIYNPATADTDAYLLHEFGHAVLGHSTYARDIDLLKMERAAWDEGCRVASDMGIRISTDLIEDSIDTYRDWLHNRSLCPSCSSTGTQVTSTGYRCIACHTEWRVNEARTCGLKRYTTKKRPL